MQTTKHYKTALSIAGFDGSGGAGIQADIKTFSALGCYGMTVLTALPVQNTQGVRSIHGLPLKAIEEQLAAIFEDITVDVVKIGMLFTEDIIQCVADFIEQPRYKHIPCVLDPVMVAKSGDPLLKPEAVSALKKTLLPRATVLTPNIPEAEVLFGKEIPTDVTRLEAAKALAQLGPKTVVIKGGHTQEAHCRDLVYFRETNEHRWLDNVRINTQNTHGTGCTFSAAIAAHLAHQKSTEEAIFLAKAYISQALEAGSAYSIGHGHGPVHHFHAFWR